MTTPYRTNAIEEIPRAPKASLWRRIRASFWSKRVTIKRIVNPLRDAFHDLRFIRSTLSKRLAARDMRRRQKREEDWEWQAFKKYEEECLIELKDIEDRVRQSLVKRDSRDDYRVSLNWPPVIKLKE